MSSLRPLGLILKKKKEKVKPPNRGDEGSLVTGSDDVTSDVDCACSVVTSGDVILLSSASTLSFAAFSSDDIVSVFVIAYVLQCAIIYCMHADRCTDQSRIKRRLHYMQF